MKNILHLLTIQSWRMMSNQVESNGSQFTVHTTEVIYWLGTYFLPCDSTLTNSVVDDFIKEM